MNVLVACEFSGVVRDAFTAAGHNAWSCDLLPSDTAGPHIVGNVLNHLHRKWDLMIAHPPCTYLASSGLHWNKRIPGRSELTEEALLFVRALLAAPIPKIALENPIGCISTRIFRPDQIIQPWQFGHAESKATCLWLNGLPPLTPTKVVQPHAYRFTAGEKPRWDNQTASGQNKLAPSPDRWKKRSITYRGIAAAMAAQWGHR